MDEKNIKINKLPKNTFEITISVPWNEIEEAQKKVIEDEGKNLEIKGFRKGMAPAKMVSDSLGKQKILELSLEKIISKSYPETITKLGIKPIVSPKIELISAKDNEPWQIKFTSCEIPQIELGNYKETLSKELKSVKIWTPSDSTPTKETEEKEKQSKDEKIQKAISYLLTNIKFEISDLLIEEEVNRKLSELLAETQKLGITVEQYLTSTGKTIESLKKEYAEKCENNLRVELLLSKIADAENVKVEPEEIEKMITSAKDEKEKESLSSQKYLIALIIRQQKTLDFLAGL